jgi:hypothetical protein
MYIVIYPGIGGSYRWRLTRQLRDVALIAINVKSHPTLDDCIDEIEMLFDLVGNRRSGFLGDGTCFDIVIRDELYDPRREL